MMDTHTYLIGSNLALTEEALLEFIDSIKKHTKQSVDTGDFIDVHNTYVLYSVSLLLFATGHRPVTDPFARIEHISAENRLVLVSDKVVSERHQWRLCAFPAIAARATDKYLKHLVGLADHLERADALGMAFAVSELISSRGSKASIPLFFLIDRDLRHTRSITKSEIEKFFQAFLPVPENFYRHTFAIWAAAEGVDARLIECQLGHMNRLTHPFGISGILSPQQFADELVPILDKWLLAIGWEVIDGIKIKAKRKKYPDDCKNDARQLSSIHESPMFGPEIRRHIRESAETKDRLIVRQALNETLGPQKDSQKRNINLTLQQTETIQRRVIDLSIDVPERSKRRINMLWRYWAVQRRLGANIVFPSRLVPQISEASPFSEFTLGEYDHALILRCKFTEYLSRAGRIQLSPTVHERIAEIIISAALFGYLADQEMLYELGRCINTGAMVIDHEVLVDIEIEKDEKKILLSRWIADSISKGLMAGLKRTSGDITTIRNDEVTKYIKHILVKTLENSKSHVNPYAELARISKALSLIELPPKLREVAVRRMDYHPLPMSALARIVTGKRLKTQSSALATFSVEMETLLSYPTRIGDDAGERIRGFVRSIRKTITEIENMPAVGGIRRREKPKSILKQSVIELLKTGRVPLPPIGVAIASWIVDLCINGTPTQRDLEFSTIATYSRRITSGLPQTAANSDFLNLSEAEYEEIYLKVLDYCPEKYREYSAARMRQFHRFLVRAVGVEEPDWSVIIGSSDVSADVDANLITLNEYRRALEIISHSDKLTELLRVQCVSLLVFGYRFGLRIGEALRLQPHDLQVAQDRSLAIITVHGNVFGNTKSIAGVRQIPLLYKIDDREWGAIMTLVECANVRRGEDRQVGLFSDAEEPRRFASRAELTKVIHTALRQVTGDRNIRFHHLRHTFATMTYLLFTSDAREQSRLINRALFSDNNFQDNKTYSGLSPDLLNELRQCIGHASIKTTYGSYLHLVEWHLLDNYSAKHLERLNDHAVTYILQVSSSYSRVRRKRDSLSPNEAWQILCHAEYQENQSKLSQVDLVRKPPREMLHIDTYHVEKVPFELVDLLLVRAAHKQAPVDAIDGTAWISRNAMSSLITNAVRAESLIGVRVYGLQTSVDGWWKPEFIEPPALLAESRRVREILKRWWEKYKQLDESELKILHGAISAGLSMLKAGKGKMLASGKKEIKQFVEGMSLIGLDINELVVCIPDDLPKVKSDLLLHEIEGLGFSSIKKCKLPKLRNTSFEYRQQRIYVGPSKESKRCAIYSEKSLRRLLVSLSASTRANTSQ